MDWFLYSAFPSLYDHSKGFKPIQPIQIPVAGAAVHSPSAQPGVLTILTLIVDPVCWEFRGQGFSVLPNDTWRLQRSGIEPLTSREVDDCAVQLN